MSQVEPLVLSGHPDHLGDSLSQLRKYVTEVSNLAGLESQVMHRLRLAVDEIAANIIMYGYANDPSGVVRASVNIDDDKLTLILEDTGTPYNPLERDMPDNLDEPLETREIGGLGVFLAIRNVDEFNYQRIGNQNRNTFVVNRR